MIVFFAFKANGMLLESSCSLKCSLQFNCNQMRGFGILDKFHPRGTSIRRSTSSAPRKTQNFFSLPRGSLGVDVILSVKTE